MLKEFVETIRELGVRAEAPDWFSIPSDPNGTYFWLPDGTYERRGNPNPSRRHSANDLDTVIEFVRNSESFARVWYGYHRVVGVLNDTGHRDDTVTFQLFRTEQFLTIAGLCDSKWMSQRDFIRLLRLSLHDCVSDLPALLERARRVRFLSGEDAASEVRPGKTSIGKSARAELEGFESLPSGIDLWVRVYDELSYRARVRCAIDVDAETQQFQIVPLAGELVTAVKNVECSIRDALLEQLADVPICYGSPT